MSTIEQRSESEHVDASQLHDFSEGNNKKIMTSKVIVLLIVVAFLGMGTGYVLAQNNGSVGPISVDTATSGGSGKVVGSDDLKTFKDLAEGKLEEGGIDGEGQYHLVRPGGESQYVYLTSSIVDLSEFVGKDVKVWGQTQAAQKAGWLMDVGRVEVK